MHVSHLSPLQEMWNWLKIAYGCTLMTQLDDVRLTFKNPMDPKYNKA